MVIIILHFFFVFAFAFNVMPAVFLVVMSATKVTHENTIRNKSVNFIKNEFQLSLSD